MNRWSSRALHDELASSYRQYRGVMAPTNTRTEDLWALIERVEAEEETHRQGRAAR